MKERQENMCQKIDGLMKELRKMLKLDIPENGIWAVCELPDLSYHGSLRVIPVCFGSQEYALHIDVFETIYDPIYSNVLVKGDKESLGKWLENSAHIAEIYDCMRHLYERDKED